MKQLFQYTKQYPKLLVVWFIFMCISMFFQVSATVLAASLLNAIIAMDLEMCLWVMAEMLLVWIITLSCDYIKRRTQNKLIALVNGDLRKQFLQAICTYDYETYHQRGDAAFVSTFTNDINQLELNGIRSFYVFIENITLAIFSFFALSMISLWLSGLSFVLFLIIYIVPKVFDKPIKQESMVFSTAQEVYTGKIKNLLQGYDVFADYDAKDQLKKRMEDHSTKLEHARIKFYNLQDGIQILVNLLSINVQLINNGACVILIMLRVITPGTIMSVGDLSGSFFRALSGLSQQRVKMAACVQLLQKNQAQLHEEKAKLPTFTRALKLQDLSFGYEHKNVLQQINLTFEKNKKYAIVGESGCGKTTLLRILSGKLTGYEGSYTMDGHEIKQMSLDSLRQQIAYIDQNAIVFDESIKDNLTLGKFYDDQSVMAAIAAGGLDDFVLQEADLQTHIVNNGDNLSGGQRQRMMIARAMLANKRIYLIDEATSNLDKEKMEKVESHLLSDPNITLIYISHHLSDTIKAQFDAIYTLP